MRKCRPANCLAGNAACWRSAARWRRSRSSGGSIIFNGERIDGMRPDSIVRRGLVQVTQGKEAFPGMTVEENLRLGAYVVRDRAKTATALERVYSYFPVLKEKRGQL